MKFIMIQKFNAVASLVLLVIAISPVHAQNPSSEPLTVSPDWASSAFRPPAVPLVTSDPYLSIWSEADRLTDDVTRHWTHHPHPLMSLIRINGSTYRLMGIDPATVPALPQTGLEVTPTRSIYNFENRQVHVTLTFMTAALPSSLDVLTRPLCYLTWTVRSVDHRVHSVSIYDSTSSLLTVNMPSQSVTWEREAMGPLTALRCGSDEQSMLSPAGDDTRIDWGYAYATAPTATSTAAVGGSDELAAQFVAGGVLPETDDARQPRAASDDTPVMAFDFNMGSVGSEEISRHMMVAYDEIYNIKFSGRELRPYWRRNGATPSTMLQAAEHDYPSLKEQCANFDEQLTADLTKVGGARYAQICALAYRQSLAATGISVDANGRPLLFTKENTSNGDIATVDVLFPTSPLWLLLSPTLAKAAAMPVLAYASDPIWKYPNSPHDLGTYPIARADGGAGEAMPVEESGNMLILCDAISQIDGNDDFVAPYWPQLTKWANFLEQYGLDPGNQLCTDDFMGPSPHNANLSVKAIIALAAYGDLCKRRGDETDALQFTTLAHDDADHWIQTCDTRDHSLLQFGAPDTWSQKYNMVWDKVLGLNVFPPSVAKNEIAWYESKMGEYGVPLDSRTKIGDTDHSFFAASIAANQGDFEEIISPFYDYLNATTARSPLVDTYMTDDIHSDGFHARSVVGGVFVRMLTDRAMWRKWSLADPLKLSSGWAGLPPKPIVDYILPNEAAEPALWKYTTTSNPPPSNWYATDFDDSAWKSGPGAFGTPVGFTTVRTPWTDTPGDLWLRRTFIMPAGGTSDLKFMVYYDEDPQIYVNGILASKATGYNSLFEPLDISPAALVQLQPGAKITLAIHVHQTTGGQGIDVGLANVRWQ